MSEGPKKNPDNLNTIGIVTVGGVGAALVYLSIVGLQAFYVDETAIVDEVRHFGDQEKARTSLKSEQVGALTTNLTRKGVNADGKPLIAIPIETAKALVVEAARVDPANLVPMIGRSEASTIQPIFGRPVALPPPPPEPVAPPADGSVPGAVPPDGAAVPTPAGAEGAAPAQPAATPTPTPTPTPAPAQPAPAAAQPPAGGQ